MWHAGDEVVVHDDNGGDESIVYIKKKNINIIYIVNKSNSWLHGDTRRRP